MRDGSVPHETPLNEHHIGARDRSVYSNDSPLAGVYHEVTPSASSSAVMKYVSYQLDIVCRSDKVEDIM